MNIKEMIVAQLPESGLINEWGECAARVSQLNGVKHRYVRLYNTVKCRVLGKIRNIPFYVHFIMREDGEIEPLKVVIQANTPDWSVRKEMRRRIINVLDLSICYE